MEVSSQRDLLGEAHHLMALGSCFHITGMGHMVPDPLTFHTSSF